MADITDDDGEFIVSTAARKTTRSSWSCENLLCRDSYQIMMGFEEPSHIGHGQAVD